MFGLNKISYKDKQEISFYTNIYNIYTNIYTEISRQHLGRKYKALQGFVINCFAFLCLSPSQKTMESILGNAVSSTLEGSESLNMLPMVCTKNSWERHG